MESIEKKRAFLKADFWDRSGEYLTDQQKGLPHPAVQKPVGADAQLIELAGPKDFKLAEMSLREVMDKRRSRRKFTEEPLSLEELSFLLWVTQGVREVMGEGVATFRTVPSAGARHALETYLVVNRVSGLEEGLYRYLVVDHKLCFLQAGKDLAVKTAAACCGQRFIADSAVVFIWTALPYRMEWRYGIGAHKVIAIDVGHVCQNLYLASEAIGAGTCAIAAYFQDQMDAVAGVDGKDEFVIYAAPVGKISAGR
jgi:SagB-type dehydrogenase family enzyme